MILEKKKRKCQFNIFPSSDSQSASAILSSQVGNRRTATAVDTDTLQLNPITLTFNFTSVNETANFNCVYWNFSEPVGHGSWESDGISIGSNRTDGNTTTVQCLSTHLTSFAVLVDVAGGLRVCLYIIMLILEMCIGTLLLIDSS